MTNKLINNITKTSHITISKNKSYFPQWTAMYYIIGTKDNKLYIEQRTPTKQNKNIKYARLTPDGTLKKWKQYQGTITRQNSFHNTIQTTNKNTDISCQLIQDNIQYIQDWLCNNNRQTTYIKEYGDHQHGCYTIRIDCYPTEQ